MLLGLGEIADHQVGLAQVFMRPAMPRVELQRARIVLERQSELAAVAVGVAGIVWDGGIARVAQSRGGQPPYRSGPVLRLDRLFAGGVVGVERKLVFSRLRVSAENPGQRCRERQPVQPPCLHFAARYCFISRSSDRSPSAPCVRRASWLK